MLFDHDGSLVTAYKLSDFEKEPSPKTLGYGGRFASKIHLAIPLFTARFVRAIIDVRCDTF